MLDYYISINQFAEFSSGTIAAKRRIIKQQKIPNKFLLPWYQAARAAMKKYFKDVNNLTPINEAIAILTSKKPESKRQQTDKKVSLEALEQLKMVAFPRVLRNVQFEIIKPIEKNIDINNVSIVVAPDVILKGKYRGEVIYGAIKIHICKTKPFDQNQSKHVANILYKYLLAVSGKNGKILPELCLCLDIFSNRVMSASNFTQKDNSELKNICEEVKKLWLL